MKWLGISNIYSFLLLNNPSEIAYIKGLENLYALRLIDTEAQLTKIGLKIQDFKMDPKLSVCLMNSFNEEFDCSYEMLLLTSILSVRNIFWNNIE